MAIPSAYLTKVPGKAQRQESRLAEKGDLSSITPKFNLHEEDLLYFDYGALRLGRRPELDDTIDAKLTCVGLGWLPGWKFTVNEAGMPDAVPAPARNKSSTGGGVLGLLFQLVPEKHASPKRLPFAKKAPIGVNDLPRASPRDWAAVIPFHSKLKTMKPVNVYIHVFDGGVGNLYQKDGAVVPFRTPDWPIKALMHVDPERPPVRAPREKPRPQGTIRCLEGEWISNELQRWIKEAKLPPEYVEKVLKRWLDAELEARVQGGGLLKFFGFKV